MRRIKTLSLAIVLLMFGAVSLAGCSAFIVGSAQADDSDTVTVTPINLSDQTVIDGLCGSDPNSSNEELRNKSATRYLDAFQAVVEDLKRYEDGGARHDKVAEIQASWGVNPEDQPAVDTAVAALKARAGEVCGNTQDGATTQLWNQDGTCTFLASVNSTEVTGVDSTADASAPPVLVLDASNKGVEVFKSFTQLLNTAEQAGHAGQVYIDYINAHKADFGPNWTNGWEDVKKFAKTEQEQKVDTRAVQVLNCPADVTEATARSMAAEIKGLGEYDAQHMAFQRVSGNFVNSRDVGVYGQPNIQPFTQSNCQIRVSLVPIVYDASGKAIGLDSSGVGIFVDCGNPHWWIPPTVIVWQCATSGCAPPAEQVCPWNPALPVGSPNCKPPTPSDAKDNRLTPDNPGWTPRGTDNGVTDGRESVRQQESGDTRGNGGQHQVGGNTGSGDNTSSTGTDVTVGGSTPGGDSPAGTVQDPGLVKDDKGGTEGATCVPTPLVSC